MNAKEIDTKNILICKFQHKNSITILSNEYICIVIIYIVIVKSTLWFEL